MGVSQQEGRVAERRLGEGEEPVRNAREEERRENGVKEGFNRS